MLMNENNLSIEEYIARNVFLSIGVEPLGYKEGLTNRKEDSSEKAKLVHFIVGASNVQFAFKKMARDYVREKSQPKSIFKYGLEAQQNTMLNRGGSKVTFGQTLILIPLVASHLRWLIHNQEATPSQICLATHDVLGCCSSLDVKHLYDLCQLSVCQSKKCNEKLTIFKSYPEFDDSRKYSKLKDVFSHDRAISKLSIANEIRSGYPIIQKYSEKWFEENHTNLLSYTEDIYLELLPLYGRGDIAADLICGVMYLIISLSGDDVIFG